MKIQTRIRTESSALELLCVRQTTEYGLWLEMRRLLLQLFRVATFLALSILASSCIGLSVAAPAPGKSLELADGQILNYFDEGSGSPVILVHGSPGSAYDWRPLGDQLLQGGYRVIRYDRIGYGYSDRRTVKSEHTLQASSRELIGLIDALGLQRVIVVGWSYGGGVAQLVARETPDRLAALVLIGSTGPLRERSRWAFLESLLFITEPLQSWMIESGWAGGTITRMGKSSFAGEPPAWWSSQTEALLALPGAAHSWIMELKYHAPEILEFDDIVVPTSIFIGTEDVLETEEVAEDLQRRIVGSQLIVIEGGSHMLPNTHPERIVQQITRAIGN